MPSASARASRASAISRGGVFQARACAFFQQKSRQAARSRAAARHYGRYQRCERRAPCAAIVERHAVPISLHGSHYATTAPRPDQPTSAVGAPALASVGARMLLRSHRGAGLHSGCRLLNTWSATCFCVSRHGVVERARRPSSVSSDDRGAPVQAACADCMFCSAVIDPAFGPSARSTAPYRAHCCEWFRRSHSIALLRPR